jgi:hypothetical protein
MLADDGERRRSGVWRTPHPPLWALRRHQSCRQHRNGSRTSRGRSACPQRATAAGCCPGCAAGSALPMSALRRPHDRHRGVRTRLRAQLAPHPRPDRHVMTQTVCGRADNVVLIRGFPRSDLARPNHLHECRVRSSMRSEDASNHPADAPHVPHLETCSSWHAPVTRCHLGADLKSP